MAVWKIFLLTAAAVFLMVAGCGKEEVTAPSPVTGPYSDLSDNTTDALVTNVVQIETGGTLAMSLARWVKVYFSVTNQNGTPLERFNYFNFALVESTDTQVVKIDSSRVTVQTVEQSGRAMATSLIMDFSASVAGQPEADMKVAIKGFIEGMRSNDAGEVIKYSDLTEVIQHYTTHKGSLNSAVDAYWPGAYGRTALYDAVYLGMLHTDTRSELKLVLPLCDGWDDASQHSLWDIFSLADSTDVRCYTIGFGADVDTFNLKEIAWVTDGRFFYAPTSADLTKVYSSISNQIMKCYVLGWEVQSPTGSNVTAVITVSYECAKGTFTSTARSSFTAP